ncbi:MAG TPA: hypothetical protein VM695_03925 [Phycisphaerae bacterium]|nr:hypothetical protein [Phycisphaerae bacterium]
MGRCVCRAVISAYLAIGPARRASGSISASSTGRFSGRSSSARSARPWSSVTTKRLPPPM